MFSQKLDWNYGMEQMNIFRKRVCFVFFVFFFIHKYIKYSKGYLNWSALKGSPFHAFSFIFRFQTLQHKILCSHTFFSKLLFRDSSLAESGEKRWWFIETMLKNKVNSCVEIYSICLFDSKINPLFKTLANRPWVFVFCFFHTVGLSKTVLLIGWQPLCCSTQIDSFFIFL